jgi:hypothetical protein
LDVDRERTDVDRERRLLAQDGVVFDRIFGIVTGLAATHGDDDPEDDDGSEGEMPDGERDNADVPPGASLGHSTVLQASADRLDEVIDGLSEGVLYGRSVVRATGSTFCIAGPRRPGEDR